MRPLRHGVLSVVGLLVFTAAFAAEKPEPGQIRKVRTLEQPGQRLASLSFSADGSRLVTSGGRSVYLWDPATGRVLIRFSYEGEYAGCAVLSPDGKTVAACFGVGVDLVLLIDAVSGKVRHRLRCDPTISGDAVFRLAFAPDGKTLVSTGWYGRTVRLWDVATGQELRWMRLRYPDTGNEVDPKQPRPPDEFTGTFGVAFSPDGKTVAVGVQDGSIRLCDPATGAEIRRLFHEDDDKCKVLCLAFSPDGRFLAAGGPHFKGGARLWEVATGKPVRDFRLPRQPRKLSPEDEALFPHLPPEEQESLKWQTPPCHARALAFSPDGKTLAIAGDKTWLWEVATGRMRLQLAAPAHALAFSPTGLLAISGHEYALVNLWDWRDLGLGRPARLEAEEIDRLWTDLAGEDAGTAYRAIATLATVPAQAVEALALRLQPVEPAPAPQIDQLITDLDDKSFDVREQAFGRLAMLGEAARFSLQQALVKHPSAEVQDRVRRLLEQLEVPLSATRLRHLRAVETLEYIGSEEARRVLRKLADGARGALETEDARAALERLARR